MHHITVRHETGRRDRFPCKAYVLVLVEPDGRLALTTCVNRDDEEAEQAFGPLMEAMESTLAQALIDRGKIPEDAERLAAILMGVDVTPDAAQNRASALGLFEHPIDE